VEQMIRYVLGHKRLVLSLIIGVTIASAVSLSGLKFGQSMGRMFFGDDPRYEAYLDRVRDFGSDEAVLVGFEAPDLLTNSGIERLRTAVDTLKAHPEVQKVTSILDAQRMYMRGDSLRIESYIKSAQKRPEQREEILAALRADPDISGALISANGRHTTVVIELTINDNRPVELAAELQDTFLHAFVDAGFKQEALRTGGLPSIMAASIAISTESLTVLFPLAALILFVTALILLRQLLPALISAGVSLIAVLWTMALVVCVDPHLGIMVSIVPVIVVIVGFADVIHLWNAYLVELASGKAKHDAIISACSEVGRACLFTSLTTFVGFFSLILVPSPAFKILAIALSFGVAMALLLAVTLMPILLEWRPAPALDSNKLGHKAHALIEDWLVRVGSFSTRRPWLVMTGFVLVLVPSFYGMAQFTVDDDLVARFPADHPVQISSTYFDTHFSGTESFDIFVDAPEKNGLLDPLLFAKLDALETVLKADPQVRDVSSVVSTMRRMYALLSDGKHALPQTREGLAQMLLLFEMSGGKDLDRLIDFDRQRMRISVRYGYLPMREGYFLGHRIQTQSQALIGDGVSVQVNGFSFLLGDWYDKLIAGQQKSLLVSALIIALMMIIGLRSISAGLWSMVPNLYPLFVLAGAMGLIRVVIDGDSFIPLIIALGIAMDDTIHFLSRYRHECKTATSMDEALNNTFRFAGRAIVITTVIIALGFLPMLYADYSVIAYWGTDVGFALVVALLADIMLIPAFIKVGLIRFAMPNAANTH
jgi:uncharacterized protein